MRHQQFYPLPSLGEGMPNSLLEAMSSGLACVSTDIGGVRELIKHNSNGLLYKAGDVQGLYGCIKSLITDQALSGVLSNNARITAVEGYSLENVAALYLKLYNDVLKAPGRNPG